MSNLMPIRLSVPGAAYSQDDEARMRRQLEQTIGQIVQQLNLLPQTTYLMGISAARTLTLASAFASNGASSGPPFNRLVITWTPTGFPSGTTFDVSYSNGGADKDSQSGLSGVATTFNGVSFNDGSGLTPGNGTITIVANYNGNTLATLVKSVSYTY